MLQSEENDSVPKEQEPKGWIITRKFPDEKLALEVYKRTAAFATLAGLDATVFCFAQGGNNYLAVLGEETLPADSGRKLSEMTRGGSELVKLEKPIVDKLKAQREQLKKNDLPMLGVSHFGKGPAVAPQY